MPAPLDGIKILDFTRFQNGPHATAMPSDLGQAANPDPPLGFGLWIERFLEAGFSEADVGRMVRENPLALLEG